MEALSRLLSGSFKSLCFVSNGSFASQETVLRPSIRDRLPNWYDFIVKALPRMRVWGVLVLIIPLAGCIGWGDMFRERLTVSGDYFLMEGEGDSTDNLYLFNRDDSNSVAGPLKRIGWNQQYIVFTDANNPTPWNVITVKDHSKFTITDIQRSQDSRLQQIAIGSTSEAWQKAKTRN